MPMTIQQSHGTTKTIIININVQTNRYKMTIYQYSKEHIHYETVMFSRVVFLSLRLSLMNLQTFNMRFLESVAKNDFNMFKVGQDMFPKYLDLKLLFKLQHNKK